MLALTLGQAKTLGIVIFLGLIVMALGAAWIMKEVMQKLALAVIFGLLALLVWTQRASVQECADKVKVAAEATSVREIDTTCSFLGRDVNIRTSRTDTE